MLVLPIVFYQLKQLILQIFKISGKKKKNLDKR